MLDSYITTELGQSIYNQNRTELHSKCEGLSRCSNPTPVFWLFYIKSKESQQVPDLVYSVCCVLVLICGVISNTVSGTLTVREGLRGPWSNLNKIYSNLLMADMCVICGFLPLEVYWTQTRDSLVICRTVKFFAFTAFYAICFLLVLLATDRYIAIVKPLKHLTNRYRRKLSVCLWTIWALSVSIGIWQAIVHRIGPHKVVTSYNLCGAEEGIAASVFTPITALFCILPFVYTLAINVVISVKLFRREKRCELDGCRGGRLQGGPFTGQRHFSRVNRLYSEKPDLSQLIKMKAVRMTVTVAFCLFASQAPIGILYTWAWLNPNKTDILDPIVLELSKVCQYVYPCIVPLLRGSLKRYRGTNTFQLSFSRHSYSMTAGTLPVHNLGPHHIHTV